MQARKEEGRSKKTTKATPQKPAKAAKAPAKTSARLAAVKAVKAPTAAKKNGTNGHQDKKKETKLEAKPKTVAKPAAPAPKFAKGPAPKVVAKTAEKAPAPPAKPVKAAKPAEKAPPPAPEPSRSEPAKSNASFARPSPWSAPPLPPVKVDAQKVEQKTDEGEFKVGETVVYPLRGVADIVAVEEVEVGGRRHTCYVLRVHDTNQRVLVPVSNAAQSGLRRPISEAQVREIFRILKVTDVPLDTQTWNRRHRGFVEKLQTGSVFAVAEVLRDLSRVKIVKEGLSFSERQMLERARGLIVKEIAVARAKPEDAVRQQIEAIFA